MQAYRSVSSQRCHQYIWLGYCALSKSSTPDLSENTSLIDTHIHTNKTTSNIMSSSGFDNAWSTYVYGNNGNSCSSSGSSMKAFGNNSSSSTKSWGSSNSSANMAGSSFGSGSSGFNNAWNTYASGSSGSSAW